MADGNLADLGVRFRNENAAQADRELDSYTAKVGGAERATDSLTRELSEADGVMLKFIADIAKIVREIQQLMAAQQGAANSASSMVGATKLASTANIQFAASFTKVTAGANAAVAAIGKAGDAATKAASQAKASAVHFDTLYDASQHDFAQQYTRQLTSVSSASDGVTKSMRNTRLAGVDLGRQFADVGVQAAMLTNPLMILVMQGPQIVDRLTDMKAQGIGLSAAMKSLAASTWAALAPLAPFIVAAGAVAAVIGGTMALAARELNKDNKDLVDSLGLTEKQLERLKDQGVDTGVTIGDVFKGTFNYIRDGIAPALAPLGKWFSDLFDSVASGAVKAMKIYIGVHLAAFEAVKATWMLLPAAMGDVAISATNATIMALEKLINMSIDGINKLIDKANEAAKATGLPQLGRLATMSFGRLENPYAGKADAATVAARQGARAGFTKADKLVDAELKSWGEAIVDAARDRIKEAAGSAGKVAKAAKGPVDRSNEELLRLEQSLAAARADELQAQLALTEDVRARADLEKELLDIQLGEKRAELAKQAAKIERDVAQKRITEATGDLMRLELAALELSAGRVASLKAELIEREAARQIIRDDYARQAGAIEDQMRVVESQRDLAKYGFERRAKEIELLKLAQQLERLKLEEIIATTAIGSVARDRALAEQALLDLIHGNQMKKAIGTSEDAFNNVANALGQAADAFRSQDWKKLVDSLAEAFGTLKAEFAKAGNTTGKIGAVAGVANVVGQAVGGKAGSALSGAAGGAMAGAAFGPWGMAIGAVIGGLGGWISGGKAEKAAKAQREAQEIENARRIALERANQQAELELRILELSGNEVEALKRRREAELAALDGANRALAEHVHKLEDWAKAVGLAKDAVSKAEDDLRDAYEAEKQRLEGIIGGVDAARERLNEAYQRERGAIEGTINSVRSLVETLADFRAELDMMSAANDPGAQYGYAQRQFASATNDNLIERGRAFANASQSASVTDRDFQRDIAVVRRRTDEASATAQNQLTASERQLAALDALVAPLLGANDNLLSVEAAIRGLTTAQQEAALASEELARLDAQVGALITINTSVLSVAQAVNNLQSALAALAAAEAAKPTNNPGKGYEAVGFEGYVDRNPDLAALYASGSGMARGRTKEEFGAYHWERYGQAETRAYRPFARGGDHMGGLRLVGEEGPELEATGPSRIFSARQTADMLRNDNSDLQQELQAIRQELAALRKERAEDARQIKQNTKDVSIAMAKVTQGGDTVRVTEVAA